MKVTFLEEIESKHAWRDVSYCAKCNNGIYEVHHQLEPETSDCWWVMCPNCKREMPHMPTRAMALKYWRDANAL